MVYGTYKLVSYKKDVYKFTQCCSVRHGLITGNVDGCDVHHRCACVCIHCSFRFLYWNENKYLSNKRIAVIRTSVINTSNPKSTSNDKEAAKYDNMSVEFLCMLTHNAVMARWIRPISSDRRHEFLSFNVNTHRGCFLVVT